MFGRILFCLGLLLAMGGQHAAGKSITWAAFGPSAKMINFDDLPTNSVVGNAYALQGVYVENGGVGPSMYAASKPNIMTAHDDRPLIIHFTRPALRVGIRIDQTVQGAQMQAFDAQGKLLGSSTPISYTPAGYNESLYFVGFEAESPVIERVEIGPPSIFSYDNLQFEAPYSQAFLPTILPPNPVQQGWFGSRVAKVPDVNGDGVEDFAVASPREPVNGLDGAGRVYLFSGKDGAYLRSFQSPQPETGGNFGHNVGGISDLDGDGKGDLAIGAPRENASGVEDSGRVYVFSGAKGTLLKTIVSPNIVYQGSFGVQVSGINDINADGKGDILVSSNIESASVGHGYIFSGANGSVLTTFNTPKPQTWDGFGLCSTVCPDMDGDGVADVLIGAPGEDAPSLPEHGRVYLMSGKTGGVIRSFETPNTQYLSGFGNSVACVPDVNGDGVADVAVGSIFECPNGSPKAAGRVYLFSGKTAVVLQVIRSPHEVMDGWFGLSLLGSQDLDGDGAGDIIVGQPFEDQSSKMGVGKVYAFSGKTGALIRTINSPAGTPDGRFGQTLAALTDMDGDGIPDLLVGGPRENTNDTPYGSGRAYLFSSKSQVIPDNAVVVGHDFPVLMRPGEVKTVGVTMKNIGMTSWREDANYKLAVNNDPNNLLQLLTPRVNLPVGLTVAPGQNYYFEMTLQAPVAPGDYPVELQMVREFVNFFGQSLQLTIRVQANATQQWVNYK